MAVVLTFLTIVLTFVAIEIAVLLLRSFFPAYASEKGKNVATKEDIEAITDKIERVKSSYKNELKDLEHRHERDLEEFRSRQQLRMAAVEKRLEVHQQAYTLWRRLRAKAHSTDNPFVFECQQWWEQNCLYLAPAAREAFLRAYFAAADHPSLLTKGSGASGADIRENFDIIMKAGEAIVAGAELPSLGEREAEDVMDKDAT